MFLRVQLVVCGFSFLVLRSWSGHRFALVHSHCIQQTSDAPLIHFNMPPRVVRTDSSFEAVSFFLMLKPQAHCFIRLYKEMLLEHSKPDNDPHTRNQHRAVPSPDAWIDVVLLEEHGFHNLVRWVLLPVLGSLPCSIHCCLESPEFGTLDVWKSPHLFERG